MPRHASAVQDSSLLHDNHCMCSLAQLGTWEERSTTSSPTPTTEPQGAQCWEEPAAASATDCPGGVPYGYTCPAAANSAHFRINHPFEICLGATMVDCCAFTNGVEVCLGICTRLQINFSSISKRTEMSSILFVFFLFQIMLPDPFL